MSFILPSTLALKSCWFGLYLNYDSGFIRCNGSNVFSSLAKFQVVLANTGAGLVHIRCVHNKKFIRSRFQGDTELLPEADEPEENQSKWSCTLFEPRAVDGNPYKVQLFHVHAKLYAHVTHSGGRKWLGLYEYSHGQNMYDITDLESLVILPKHVAFKADNGSYLQKAESNLLRFISNDKGMEESGFEVYTDGDGKAKIKVFNSSNSNYWRFGGKDYIFADGDSSSGSNPPTEFLPVKIDASTVALTCLANNKFCKRYTVDDKEHTLSAPDSSSSITRFVRLGLEELVLSRKVYDTRFDLEHAIIYSESPIILVSKIAANNTSVDNTTEFKFKYTVSQSHTWSASHSWMAGMSVTVSFKIPFIGGTDVTANAEYSGSYEWGETVTTEKALEDTYTVTVPAHTTTTVSIIATQGKCDVPYSYYVRDLLYNGKTIIYQKYDGLCTGVNSYNFQYKVTEQRKPDSKKYLPKSFLVPLSMPPAYANVQIPLTSTTTLEQELSLPQVDNVPSCDKEPLA